MIIGNDALAGPFGLPFWTIEMHFASVQSTIKFVLEVEGLRVSLWCAAFESCCG